MRVFIGIQLIVFGLPMLICALALSWHYFPTGLDVIFNRAKYPKPSLWLYFLCYAYFIGGIALMIFGVQLIIF